MARFTFHVVWILLTVAGVCAVFSGPSWGYLPASVMAMILAAFITAYPTDPSLRWTLGAFGVLVIAGGLIPLVTDGLTRLTLHGSVPVFLTGVACVWSAIFPLQDMPEHGTTAQ